MPWYDQAVFYHIYPLGLSGAPRQNPYEAPVHRLRDLRPWIAHIRSLNCSALYIGPLFESVGHGYETTDYRKLDTRLGDNADLKEFVAECHRQGVRVILDGVFNHVGRDFFAFQDLKRNREGSPYRDWFCNVNFWNNNEYNDGFSYDNWGGYNLLVKLNQRNPAVRDYILDAVRFWVSEFDIDGLRLDAADVLDFGFMQALRGLADTVKPEFWLMGEVIHGDYTRWANEHTLHSVTDYHLHKALYSGHNDHNYFEIAHTVKRLWDMGLNHPGRLKLYTFCDNHDVERIYTKLREKAHFTPVHVLLYTLPGIPSIYYGSEFGIEGQKQRGSDDNLRPTLSLADFAGNREAQERAKLIGRLGLLRRLSALYDGDYTQLHLTTQQYAFARSKDGVTVLTAVNNAGGPASFRLPAPDGTAYTALLSGEQAVSRDGGLNVTVPGNSGEVWVPSAALASLGVEAPAPIPAVSSENQTPEKAGPVSPAPKAEDGFQPVSPKAAPAPEAPAPAQPAPEKRTAPEPEAKTAPAPASEKTPGKEKTEKAAAVAVPWSKPYEQWTVEELQAGVLEKLAKNGPITERMRRDVEENIWKNSLVNWIRSFR